MQKVVIDEKTKHSFRHKGWLYPDNSNDCFSFYQFCDTHEEAKTALLNYIKEQIEIKDKQIEKINCERSELTEHAVGIKGE